MQVVAEVVVTDRDTGHVPGQVLVAQGVVFEGDRGLAVPPLVLDIGEGGEGLAEPLGVVGVLEGLPAVQQQGQRVIDAAEAEQ